MLENVNDDFEEAIGGLDAVTKKTQELIKKSGESFKSLLSGNPFHTRVVVLSSVLLGSVLSSAMTRMNLELSIAFSRYRYASLP